MGLRMPHDRRCSLPRNHGGTFLGEGWVLGEPLLNHVKAVFPGVLSLKFSSNIHGIWMLGDQ